MPEPISNNSNLAEAYRRLTTDWITKRSGGKLQPFTPAGAAGFLGNTQVETGSWDLTDMDVVEDGNGSKGRGISQFTGPRRTAYDRAREQAVNAGIDPNNLDFQMGHIVDEYLGKHDGVAGGNSLSGYSKAFETCGQKKDPVKASICFNDEYFRPSEPHMERRMAGAKAISDIAGQEGFTLPTVITKDNPYARKR